MKRYHRRRYSLQEAIKKQTPVFPNTVLKDVTRRLATQVDARKLLDQMIAAASSLALGLNAAERA
eukprot:1219028-Pleurochrysis_carterae.AAC.1